MKNKLLTEICEYFKSQGIVDISKSILSPRMMPELDSGFMRMLSWLPEENLGRIVGCNFTGSTTIELYKRYLDAGLLEFSPYVTMVDGEPVLVCAINRFVTYRNKHFMLVTDPCTESVISLSHGNVYLLIQSLQEAVSADAYNALIAEILCTAHLCKNLRTSILADNNCIADFLKVILKDAKCLPIYSTGTFKSKITWVDLSKESNANFSIENKHNISIGVDGVTINYYTDFGTVESTTFVYELDKLTTFNGAFSVAAAYFAFALYLLVKDNNDVEFENNTTTLIDYKPLNSIFDLYRM